MKEPVYWQTAYARFRVASLSPSLSSLSLSPPLNSACLFLSFSLPFPSLSLSLSLCSPFSLFPLHPSLSRVGSNRAVSRKTRSLSLSRSLRQASVYALRGKKRERYRKEREGEREREKKRQEGGKERTETVGRQASRQAGRRERVVSGHRKRAVSRVCVGWPVRERTPRCTDLSPPRCVVSPRACFSLSLSLSLFLSLFSPTPLRLFCLSVLLRSSRPVYPTRRRSLSIESRKVEVRSLAGARARARAPICL